MARDINCNINGTLRILTDDEVDEIITLALNVAEKQKLNGKTRAYQIDTELAIDELAEALTKAGVMRDE